MAEQTLPPILYWSRARAEHPDACETAPGVVIDTASRHGLVLGSAHDSWEVLSGLPDDAVRLVAEPRRAISVAAAADGVRPAARSDEHCDLLELAWGVIANAGLGFGGWSHERPGWVEAAERWRDRWHELLAAHCAPSEVPSADVAAWADERAENVLGARVERAAGPAPDGPTWRQGGKVPHHLYQQRGPEPDRRPYPDGDDPIGIMLNPDDAALAVRAVNALGRRTNNAGLNVPAQTPESGGDTDEIHIQVRDALREKHARCDPRACSLANIWTDDVAEVLEAARDAIEQGQDGAGLIAAERRRQVDVEGWTAEHDAGHADDALILAAACYLLPFWRRRDGDRAVPLGWPWAPEYWKPSPDDRVRELVKVGALVAAEIDRRQAAVQQDGVR